jgi:hypothetical protein
MHGTQPNQSTATCRMAQFLKAFSRSSVFPSSVRSRTSSLDDETMSETLPHPRLVRRAMQLKEFLIRHGSYDGNISPLGARMFGLDVLDDYEDDVVHGSQQESKTKVANVANVTSPITGESSEGLKDIKTELG